MSPATVPRSVVLIGFMGTGKSAVGRELATLLGLEFIDVDEEIVARAGLPVAAIFAREGEAGFRRLEREALSRACRRGGAVIAAGGGAPCDPGNLEVMKEAGPVVLLGAGVETILGRLAGDDSRPLLAAAERREAVERLLAERQSSYRLADLAVDTDSRTPGEVAREIFRLLTTEGGPWAR